MDLPSRFINHILQRQRRPAHPTNWHTACVGLSDEELLGLRDSLEYQIKGFPARGSSTCRGEPQGTKVHSEQLSHRMEKTISPVFAACKE
jgi:hypothetical protein